jgi:hypothetical protein
MKNRNIITAATLLATILLTSTAYTSAQDAENNQLPSHHQQNSKHERIARSSARVYND